MNEVIIHSGLKVSVIDQNPIPIPGPHEIIVKVVVAATNPIDWKSTSREEEIELHGEIEPEGYVSYGKDVSGTVHSVGSEVADFNIGDRVAATNHGSGYAEFSVSPAHTTRHIPNHVSFEASSAVGAYALKLAKLSNLHPIIAIAGGRKEFVNSIIDPMKGDAVPDYRQEEEKLVDTIRQSLPANEKINYIFDAIGTPKTINLLGRVVS